MNPEINRDQLANEMREILNLSKENTKESVNNLGEPIHSLDMAATGIGRKAFELKKKLDGMQLKWTDLGATAEESKYLDFLWGDQVSQ